MSENKLTNEQLIQEKEYIKPYHYFIKRNSFEGNFYFAYLDKCIKLVNQNTNKKILDAGCGDGFFLSKLDDKKNKLYGLDYSSRALDLAKLFNTKKNINFIKASVDEIPYADDYFDIITSIAVIEHLPPEIIDKSISETARVLKPGGVLILALPTYNLKLPLKHFRHFSYEDVIEICKKYFFINKYIGCYDYRYNFILKLFDNRYYDIKFFSNILKGSLFYKKFARCNIRHAQMIIYVFEKIN